MKRIIKRVFSAHFRLAAAIALLLCLGAFPSTTAYAGDEEGINGYSMRLK